MYLCKRNDLVFALNTPTSRGAWNRVVRVDHEPGHPVVLHLADGTRLVGDAKNYVAVRRLLVLPGGKS
jgi:hypothetical protein